jgi:hypothetical protein
MNIPVSALEITSWGRGMSEPKTIDLGPATEARLAEAFAEKALLTATATAELLDIDVRSLRENHQAGLILAVRVGRNSYRYTEADVRAYLSSARTQERASAPRQPQGRR